MQSSFHFLVLFILLPLLFVESRNLASSNNGLTFVVDLIHRNSSQQSILGSISSNHNFRLSSTVFYNKEDSSSSFVNEVIPNGGDYLMKISIGTPPVELKAVVDTGSNLMWVQCSPCQQCIPQKSPLFNPEYSSTYHPLPCQACNFLNIMTSCIPNYNTSSCAYTAKYGDGTQSIGIFATDTLTLSSINVFPSTILGCGYSQKGAFGIDGDGLIGLGLGSYSLVSQLGPKINYKFSHCLTPLSSDVNGKLKFGNPMMGSRIISTPLVTHESNPTFYQITLDSVSIENTTLVVVGKDVIIDSGTTLIYLEMSVYEGVRNAVKGSIGLKPVNDPNQVYDPCYDAQQTVDQGSGSLFNPPDIVFNFKGADVVLKAVNTFRIMMNNMICLAMVPTHETFISGNMAQVNFEVGYDLQAKQVSFSPTDCTKYY